MSRWLLFRRSCARRTLRSTDDKTLHEEEERRLFYVAMTRAKDTLAIYANRARARRIRSRPSFCASSWFTRLTEKFWSTHPAAAVQDELCLPRRNSASPWSAIECGGLAADAAVGELRHRLSASAIEIYEQCPLRFKLEREWNLPRDVPASLHYGAAMHACCTPSTMRSATTGDRRRRFAGTVPVRPGGCGHCRPLSVRSVSAAGKGAVAAVFRGRAPLRRPK
jgi:hypothetical protein